MIGTGSSGIQSIPEIAKEAAHVTVLQRTPQYAFPRGNRPDHPRRAGGGARELGSRPREDVREPGGFPFDAQPDRAASRTRPSSANALYEKLWQRGGFKFFLDLYNDIAVSEEANDSAGRLRARQDPGDREDDPETAEKLMPDHFVMTKRPILDNGYFETFNRDNVTLVDLREDPIERFTTNSVVTRVGRAPHRHARARDRLRRHQRLDAAPQSEGARRRQPQGALAGPLPQLSRHDDRRLSRTSS